MSEVCDNHYKTVEDLAVIKADISHIRERIDNEVNFMRRHIEEGDKAGGFRDRVLKLESDISALKKAEWFRVIVSGILGGLIANGSSDAFRVLVNWIIK